MYKFTIPHNEYLGQEIQAFYHTDFPGWQNPGNPDYINILKNNYGDDSKFILDSAVQKLEGVLRDDLPHIMQSLQLNSLTVCVVPRAKAVAIYQPNQLLFKSTVRNVVNQLNGFYDGTDYIIRHTSTRTTHLRRPRWGYNNDGPIPYRGITTATCNISDNVRGRDILLIDDVYTSGVNIDEDAIQALLDNGAHSVTFYAVGRTVRTHFNI
ncbi:MAG: amidophosphoribosyltransferase [Candidatus Loosdrechtia sp.]|uniref:phosphoribosyltransferase n=1 Tax=Candidatus Loosdrechtia sp. TaxID=3101272 RepID=UPI003A699C38|nr:MAG: phosphoribosyltransferase [Candidatus Jettenia sp. AMX2]